MAKAASMNLIGMKALDRLLAELPDKVSRKVQRKAVMAGSTIVRKAYRRNLKTLVGKVTGTLRRSPGRRIRSYKRTNTVVAIVGPFSGRARHAHLIEYGTKGKERFTKAGKSTGIMPAFAPLRKAWDSSLPKVKAVMRKKLSEELKKEAKGLKARYVRRKLDRA